MKNDKQCKVIINEDAQAVCGCCRAIIQDVYMVKNILRRTKSEEANELLHVILEYKKYIKEKV